ncbi:MAG: bifunctional demethylmenaquinone methyltransferase/2-methoxy-6-polyprenyl-1,4-benzoquinol methylase UbiE [Pedosphaera sp.]|nr:bifunctional demethylmenaquinone methyltransferase/2-methoxy-6-polyprenyl-1,4-benzoquinol methylase UbiE [Pedosphaera sp.]
MSNTFYAPGEQRAAKVHALFATIARRYDLINDVQSFGMHRRWKRRLVALANVKPGDRALDVCCGTGDIAFALAAKRAEVTGLDFTEQMITVAEAKKQKAESGKLNFVCGDAMNLPFAESTFDAVTVGYGLRNLASWETGLSEMIRVAKPGGRVVVLDFGKPDSALWRTLYFGYLRLCVPVFGLVFARQIDAYAYILESLKHYPAQRGVEARMRELGLKNISVVNLIGGAMSFNYGEKTEERGCPGRSTSESQTGSGM